MDFDRTSRGRASRGVEATVEEARAVAEERLIERIARPFAKCALPLAVIAAAVLWWLGYRVIAGFCFLLAAACLIWFVEELTLPPYLSRIVGTLSATGLYYYVGNVYLDVKLWAEFAPGILIIPSIGYVFVVYRDPKLHFLELFMSSVALFCAAVCIGLSLYLFTT